MTIADTRWNALFFCSGFLNLSIPLISFECCRANHVQYFELALSKAFSSTGFFKLVTNLFFLPQAFLKCDTGKWIYQKYFNIPISHLLTNSEALSDCQAFCKVFAPLLTLVAAVVLRSDHDTLYRKLFSRSTANFEFSTRYSKSYIHAETYCELS